MVARRPESEHPLNGMSPSSFSHRATPFMLPGHEEEPTTSPTNADIAGSTAEPALEAPLPPFGRFELLARVAQGGMGIVYRARDTGLNRIVALKVMRSGDLAGPDEILRFQREAQAGGTVFHPNIVPIFEVGQHSGQPYFTMPFVAGGSLRNHLARLGNDPTTSVALMIKIARGVQHAHDQGILHRDLKPSNILLGDNGEPLVADFGLAKLADSSLDLTQPGQQLGTPAYMAPEQVAGQVDRISSRTDVWALGVILYEMLTGKLPFCGGTKEEVFRAVLRDEPPALRSLVRTLDRSLETIVLKCLEKEPKVCCKSAGELADDLQQWLAGKRIRPTGLFKTLRRTCRRHPVLSRSLVLAGVTAIFLLALLPWVFRPDPMKVTADRLASGEAVTFIGENGRPLAYRFSTGEDSGRVSLSHDNHFSVDSWKLSLVELVQNPCRSFFFQVTMRHDQSDYNARVGLYLFHQQQDGARGRLDFLYQFTFNDLKDPADLIKMNNPKFQGKGTHATLQPLFHLDAPGDPEVYLPALTSSQHPLAPGKWRTLKVEVTPQKVRGFWDGQSIGELEWERIESETTRLNPAITKLGAQSFMDPRKGSGLGLLVQRGAASFKNVVVQPLD